MDMAINDWFERHSLVTGPRSGAASKDVRYYTGLVRMREWVEEGPPLTYSNTL